MNDDDKEALRLIVREELNGAIERMIHTLLRDSQGAGRMATSSEPTDRKSRKLPPDSEPKIRAA